MIDQPQPLAYGRLGVSERLRRFTDVMPYERGPILEFVIEAARSTPAGGAGGVPCAEPEASPPMVSQGGPPDPGWRMISGAAHFARREEVR